MLKDEPDKETEAPIFILSTSWRTGSTFLEKWIANILPPQDRRRDAFLKFFHELYEKPAKELGFHRWGFKETRAGKKVVHFLKWLYPEAKIIALNRHPLSCLLSIKRRNWIDRDNDRLPYLYFSRHWNRLARELIQIKDIFHVRYEDLVNDQESASRLSEYLGVRVCPTRQKRVDWKAENREELNVLEKLGALHLTREGRKLWGYGARP